MLRTETRSRARALQLLYAWEVQGRPALDEVAFGVARLIGARPKVFAGAEQRAAGVVGALASLDHLVGDAAMHWRLERIGLIERNILRLGILELQEGAVPPKTAIDEAVTLAHWFGGARAPAFVNGVLDGIARTLGRL
ncbi:MAG TPA: transcription antitermination factor NusB [Gemmatimonadales bacterium]|nr:transcription antitermination factor NusB [Gemmatimonadales bacterium]